MEIFMVRVFSYSVQMQENTDQKKTRIWTLFMQFMFTQESLQAKIQFTTTYFVIKQHFGLSRFNQSDDYFANSLLISLKALSFSKKIAWLPNIRTS